MTSDGSDEARRRDPSGEPLALPSQRSAPDLIDLPGVVDTLEPPRTNPVNITAEQTVQLLLAIAFTVILAATATFACFAAVFASATGWANVKSLLELLLPVETSLLGTAVGFYFGTKKQQSRHAIAG